MTKPSAESIIQFQDAPLHRKSKRKPAAKAVAYQPMPLALTIATLIGFENGQPIVDFSANRHGKRLMAMTGVPLKVTDIGRQVTLAFADGDPQKPVILNLLIAPTGDGSQQTAVDIRLDGEKLLLTANREIVLRCGEASITLTAAGKLLLKGSYVLSRSSGYNKIKGAAVDIN